MTMPVQNTFYWYDYETFGLDPRADRPAQFAGIRTDMNMNPIGAPDIWYCKPQHGYLPAPEACLLTGITPQIAEEKGLPEAEFARRIYERMNEPGTISVGYNSLKFDDEVTRFLFWRNFYDVYGREWKNGCSRWDLLPFVRACWALRPEGVNWPDRETEGEDGGEKTQKSFRLEKLSKANGLDHEHAHDASSDVLATVALAKLLADRQPRFWSWALKNRSKQAVGEALGSGEPCVLIDPSAGQERGFVRVVLPIPINTDYKNEVLVWDLLGNMEPESLIGMSPEEIARRAFGRRADLKPGEERIPVRVIRINTFPVVCGNLKVLIKSKEVCDRLKPDLEKIEKAAERFNAIKAEIAGPVQMARELALGSDEKEKNDPDSALYEGFLASEDQWMMNRLHEAEKNPEQLASDIVEGRIHFEDPRLAELFFRYRARNYPQTLSEEEMARWSDFCRDRLYNGNGGAQTLESYFKVLDDLAQKNDDELKQGKIDDQRFKRNQGILDALRKWGKIPEERTEVV